MGLGMRTNQFYYTIYGVTLASEIEYSQLLPAKATEAVQLWLRVVPELVKNSTLGDSGQVFCVNKEKILFSNQKGVFQIRVGRIIEICPKKGVALEELSPFVFGYCMAMVFWQQGKLAIHCSAVKFQERAFLLCGGSGSGKSTLTARWLKNGAKLLADDVAVVDILSEEKALVYPAFPQQKLCRDAVLRNHFEFGELIYLGEDRDKFAVSRRECFCDTVTELGGMIFLNRYHGNSVVLQQLQGHAALLAVLEHLFMRPVFAQSCAFPPEDMEKCIQLAKAAPAVKLVRPMTGDTTSEQLRLLKKITG